MVALLWVCSWFVSAKDKFVEAQPEEAKEGRRKRVRVLRKLSQTQNDSAGGYDLRQSTLECLDLSIDACQGCTGHVMGLAVVVREFPEGGVVGLLSIPQWLSWKFHDRRPMRWLKVVASIPLQVPQRCTVVSKQTTPRDAIFLLHEASRESLLAALTKNGTAVADALPELCSRFPSLVADARFAIQLWEPQARAVANGLWCDVSITAASRVSAAAAGQSEFGKDGATSLGLLEPSSFSEIPPSAYRGLADQLREWRQAFLRGTAARAPHVDFELQAATAMLDGAC